MGKLYSTSVQIRDPQGNYLWIRRSSTAPSRAGQYEHPGGHAERGETAKEAARREIREETGIKIRDDELRLVERTTGPKGDHVTYSYTIRKAVRPKLSFEHDHFVWSPEKPALSNGFLSKYMQGKDTSGMTTKQKAKGVAVSVGTKAATRAAGKAIAKKMAARAAASAAVKVGTAGTGVGIFVTGGMMAADAAPEAWAVVKEADAHRKQAWSEVRVAKGASAKLKAAALGGGKGVLHMSTAPLRVGAASIFGSGTVKMAREAAGEALAARTAKQNGVGEAVVRGMGRAAGYAPQITKHAGTLLTEGGKLVGLAATTVIGGTVAVKTAKAAWKDAKKNPSSIAENVAEINKMLKNMPTDWQSQLSINRAELKAAGADSSQLPPASPNAHNILLALNLNNRGEVSSEAAAGQEQPSGKTVPDDVREAAMEGVRLSYQNNYGGYHLIGLGRAIQLAVSPKISDAAFNRMRMYFNRKTKQDRLSDQYANKRGKRYWSWLNWGGDPGARWTKSSRFAQLVKSNPSPSPSQSPLHRFAAQYPHKFKVGVNPHGRVCLMVLDTEGQKTGQFCYSEDKAREIMARKSSPKEECQTCANAVPHVSSPSDKLPLLVPLLDDYLLLNTAPGKKAKEIKAFQDEHEHLAILSAAYPSPGAYEFVVDKQTQEVWRSDSHGRPQPHHNYGTMDNILRAGKLTTYRNPRF